MTTTTPTDEELIDQALDRLDAPATGPAAEEARADLARPMPWVPSPTLAALARHRRPSPKTLCEGCPNAVWFATPQDVKCYCRVMYITVYSDKERNELTACDGIWIGQDE